MDADGLLLALKIIAPDLIEQCLSRDDATVIIHEDAKQSELLGRESHRLAPNRELLARRIEDDLPQNDRVVVSRRNRVLTAQSRLHARQKLMKGKRLGNVVVGAQLERQNLVDLLILRGQHD